MAPLYFKKAVDALATQTHVAAQAAVMALLWSGGCRIVNGLAKELQHPIFTPVAQARLHRIALTWSRPDGVCQHSSCLCLAKQIPFLLQQQPVLPLTQHAITPQPCCCCGCVISCQCLAVVIGLYTLITTVVGSRLLTCACRLQAVVLHITHSAMCWIWMWASI